MDRAEAGSAKQWLTESLHVLSQLLRLVSLLLVVWPLFVAYNYTESAVLRVAGPWIGFGEGLLCAATAVCNILLSKTPGNWLLFGRGKFAFENE